jgi:hypothetical protein
MMMQRWTVVCVALALLATPVMAINPGTDIYVAAAFRGAGAESSQWSSNLDILNVSTEDANVVVYWLQRDMANTNPLASSTMTIQPGETMAIDDAIMTLYGVDEGGGAFYVESDQEIVVTSGIFNTDPAGKRFGQAFEGVPVEAAISAAATKQDSMAVTHTGGIDADTGTRANLYAVGLETGTELEVSILDTDGNVLGTRSWMLGENQPMLVGIDQVGAPSTLNDVTVQFTAVSGSVIGCGVSEVNNDSGDPITNNAWWPMDMGGDEPPPADCGGDGVYTGFVQYTFQGGLLIEVQNDAITYLSAAHTLFTSQGDGGSNCANVYGFDHMFDTPVAIAQDGSFNLSFEVAFSGNDPVLTFDVNGLRDTDTLLGTWDLNVDSQAFDGCNGDMNQVQFFAGHTLVTLE